ncbi:MAG: mannonate dehydratase [SAR324 cluster bacterium]|nr:mannonate dehydratase [SAR324 cluster bacterium]
MSLEQTWRWYGPEDPILISEIRQAGATGIVHALHHVGIGEVWSVKNILDRKRMIEWDDTKFPAKQTGLRWSVVESVPVHENIKTRQGEFQQYIEAYKETIQNLGKCGISTICYNFMPVLDWTRTNFEYEMEDGSTALFFDINVLAAFDCYILKRPNAERSYSEAEISAAKKFYADLTETEAHQLAETILMGLPGSEKGYSLEEIQTVIDTYRDISPQQLKNNLAEFLKEIIPVAEEAGVYMAIHPDDPPRPLLGLPRILSTEKDLSELLKMVDSPNNGFTMCTGSYGANPENDLVGMIKRYGSKIHFTHLRSTKFLGDRPGCFYEADHLGGDADMYGIVRALIEEQKKRIAQGRKDHQIPMRPDHGHRMLDDLKKEHYPGYSLIGRLKGLAELRGLEMGIERTLLQ